MNIVALSFYFVATFGLVWLLCVRASDWQTDRWSDGPRAMALILGACAWLFCFGFLGEKLFDGNAKRSDAVMIASAGGVLGALVMYVFMARVRPGFLGASRMKPSEPMVVPKRLPKNAGGWLALDVRAIPTLFRRRRAGRK